MAKAARYDGFAEYYDMRLREFTLASTDVVRRLLGRGPGRHLPLAQLLQAFAAPGLVLDRFEEPGDADYPYVLALAAHKP